MIKVCPNCNKEYYTVHSKQKYCSRECAFAKAAAGVENDKNKPQTICWTCANANDICSWHSKAHKPVKDWQAIPTTVGMGTEKGRKRRARSYIVTECPNYREEKRR